MRFDCRCDRPLTKPTHPNPRKRDTCIRCQGYINPEWDSTDQNVRTFFQRLEEATPGSAEWMAAFRSECQERERAGRGIFGHEYLNRDNPAEAQEEANDGALYLYLDGLRARREGLSEEADVALTAAHHFAEAWRYCEMLKHKRRGNTGPGMDE